MLVPVVLVVFAISAIVNYLTLYFVARRTTIGVKNLHTSKAFLVGDFFLIPLYFVALSFFVTSHWSQLYILAPSAILLAGLLAGVVTICFGIRFKLLDWIWVPHGMFHWVIVCSFLIVTYLVFVGGVGNWLQWLVLLALLLLHQFGANRLGTKHLPTR